MFRSTRLLVTIIPVLFLLSAFSTRNGFVAASSFVTFLIGLLSVLIRNNQRRSFFLGVVSLLCLVLTVLFFATSFLSRDLTAITMSFVSVLFSVGYMILLQRPPPENDPDLLLTIVSDPIEPKFDHNIAQRKPSFFSYPIAVITLFLFLSSGLTNIP
ncbi:hypothetical protein GEMRC1_011730 [Eukaryota sp. GEM-RC1]